MAEIGIITFQLEHINFCVDADQILEIVRFHGVRKIPAPLPHVVGMLELRKHLVTVVDVRKRLGLSPISLSPDTVMIVAMLSSGTFGLLVEAISDFRRVSDQKILPPISIAGFPEFLLKGVLAEHADIMLFPDLDKILSSFIHVHLVPITPSEKIAFHYRFTPGALSQTLEKNILNQHKLDGELVKKLSQSLCIPSVQVHRMISYYRDFQSGQPRAKHQEARLRSHHLKAGDEKYVALSEQLHLRQHSVQENTPVKEPHASFQPSIAALMNDSQELPARLLERILHDLRQKGTRLFVAQDKRFAAGQTTEIAFGRTLAARLRLTPVRLTKYFRYYLQALSARPVGMATGQTFVPKHPEQASGSTHVSARLALLRLLATLQRTQAVLTPDRIAQLCAEYQIPPVKLAKLMSFFPECRVAVEFPSANAAESAPAPEEDVLSAEQHAPVNTEKILPFDPVTLPLGECFGRLAHHQLLPDPHTLRHVAARLRVATCRLSKIQTYYRWTA